MYPPAISKNYGVAGTLLSLGRALISLNYLLSFTFDNSNWEPSVSLLILILSVSKKFSRARSSFWSPPIVTFDYLLASGFSFKESSKRISYTLSNSMLLCVFPFYCEDEFICASPEFSFWCYCIKYLDWHLQMTKSIY